MVDLHTLPYFVKICGVTSVDDALAIHASGATALGLILATSTRQVSIVRARDIANATEGLILRAAVFRNDPTDFVCEVVDETGVEIVQIHGHLKADLLTALRRRDVTVVKALALGEKDFGDFDEGTVDAVLVDGPIPGSGEGHAWTELLSRRFNVPVIAAGGLSPSNVASVIEAVRPWGVDVATGVESSPGVKDLSLVTSFVELARKSFMQREE